MLKLPKISSQYIALNGGLDLSTPPISKANSEAIVALNVQPVWGGGFSRIDGYECVDGKTVPSEMRYSCLSVKEPINGVNHKGKNFSLNGVNCTVIDITDRNIIAAHLTPLSAEIHASFSLENSTFTLAAKPHIDVNDITRHQQLKAEAFKVGVDSVQPAMGVGNVLGIVELNDKIIAFRDYGEQCGVVISSDDGWSTTPTTYLVQLKNLVKPKDFIDGITANANGEFTILSAVIAPDSKSGFIVVHKSLERDADIQINGETAAAVLSSEPVILAKGKSWQFIYHNFYGGSDTRYAYGVNGEQVIEVRPEGSIIPIAMNGTENPRYICAHKNHLFIAFRGGKLGHSQVGYPTHWSTLLGAQQFGLGDEITAIASSVGGVLLIGCEHKISALYGSISENWALKDIAKVGVSPNTLQALFAPIAISRNGIIRIDQTEQFGDFIAAELDANRKLGEKAVHRHFLFSSTVPERNQVRFYAKNGTHLCVMLLPNGNTRSTEFSFPDNLQGVWQAERNTYFSFEDGKVYRRSDVINSFSGKTISWLLRLAYNHCGSPTLIKSWHYAELQSTAANYLNFNFQYDLDYGSPVHPRSKELNLFIRGSGGSWDESLWNEFLWSAEYYSTPLLRLSGYSKNISLLFAGSSDYSPNFEITGLVLSYITRRNQRV